MAGSEEATEMRAEEADRPSMADISHTNPYTGSTLGGVFRRGPAVADGGAVTDETDGSDDDAADSDRTTMADVDHTSRASGVNDVWTRGVARGSISGCDVGGDRR